MGGREGVGGGREGGREGVGGGREGGREGGKSVVNTVKPCCPLYSNYSGVLVEVSGKPETTGEL